MGGDESAADWEISFMVGVVDEAVRAEAIVGFFESDFGVLSNLGESESGMWLL